MTKAGFLLISEKGSPGGVEIAGAALNAIATHKSEKNAHTPQQVGAEPVGAIDIAIAAHASVPNVHTIAQVSGLQGALDSLQPTISRPTWNNINLINAWSGIIGYLKSVEGFVLVQGLVNKSSKPTSGQIIGVLPVGFRPAYLTRSYTSDQSGTNRLFVDINNDGEIIYSAYSNVPSNTFGLLINLWFYIGKD